MKSEIAGLIGKNRSNLGLTQDQFGRKYNVSGPAIFKFEKGYVKPSLDLWLQMAKDMTVNEQTAVLMWLRAKLPRKYQNFIDLEPVLKEVKKPSRVKESDKQLPSDPEEARKIVVADRAAPAGLKKLLKDNDLWSLYKPTSLEIQTLRFLFGQLGEGTKSSFREALRLVREFEMN